LFCSSACRQAAYRERRANGEPPTPTGLTLEELLARNEHVDRADDLEAILRGSERAGIVEKAGDVWRLTDNARREHGAALAQLENA
jgi:hypothetical protein